MVAAGTPLPRQGPVPGTKPCAGGMPADARADQSGVSSRFLYLSIRKEGYNAHEQYPVYLRVRVRRPSGQSCRPDFRCRAGRHPCPGSECPSGLRNHGQDRRGDRLGRDHHRCLGRHRGPDAQGHPGDRLRLIRGRLRRCYLRRAEPDRQAVSGHQPRCRPQECPGAGCRGPGPHVRLCMQRDTRPHAGADLLLASAGRAAGQGSQEQEFAAAMAAPGRQEPGNAAL